MVYVSDFDIIVVPIIRRNFKQQIWILRMSGFRYNSFDIYCNEQKTDLKRKFNQHKMLTMMYVIFESEILALFLHIIFNGLIVNSTSC